MIQDRHPETRDSPLSSGYLLHYFPLVTQWLWNISPLPGKLDLNSRYFQVKQCIPTNYFYNVLCLLFSRQIFSINELYLNTTQPGMGTCHCSHVGFSILAKADLRNLPCRGNRYFGALVSQRLGNTPFGPTVHMNLRGKRIFGVFLATVELSIEFLPHLLAECELVQKQNNVCEN